MEAWRRKARIMLIDALRHHPAASPAIIDAGSGVVITYADLSARISDAAGALARLTPRGLVFLLASNTPASIVAYLACLDAGYPVCLLDTSTRDGVIRLLETYRPMLVLGTGADIAVLGDALEPAGAFADGLAAARPANAFAYDAPGALHSDLGLLLTTSGSTGNPKLVRLTHGNVGANASSIARYLDLSQRERAVQSLPMHYSYGLSLINSHLFAGASIVLTEHSFMRPEFWAVVGQHACTSFAGVPYMYETLTRLRFKVAAHPSLRTLTQAGGNLRADLKSAFYQQAAAGGVSFFAMYGQTEATARISYVPPGRLGDKLGSIGIAIPDGALTLDLAGADGDDALTELVYRGPNVMLGYAELPADLALGDLQHGQLRTGDLATVDADGYFSITGRLKRFAKLFGKRVSLDDIENAVEAEFGGRAAAIERGDKIALFVVPPADGVTTAEIARRMSARMSAPPAAFAVMIVDALPMTGSGKKDYKQLAGGGQ
jgi:long-chain acyl-CoA synthetase